MDDAEKIIEMNEEFLKNLSLEERAKALLSLKNFIDRGIATSQETIVFSPGKSMETAPAIESKTDSMICRPINYYIIAEKIGEGGMGTVYRAFDPELESDVALKILHKDDKELFERFIREGKLTRQLDHQNYIRVYSVGSIATPSGQRPFYTMPLIRGETLEKLVARRNLPGQEGEKLRSSFTLTRLLLFVQKICEVMQCAHDKKIIHRDLKPSNIMIGPYGEPYIMDLGLGKRLKDPEIDLGSLEAHVQHSKHNDEKNLTMDSGIGTPFYMAPEQIFTPQKVDHRTDIFAIGGILYYILTGQHPHYVLPLELVQYGFTSGTFDDYSYSEIMKECNIIPPSSVIGEKRKLAMDLGVNLPMSDLVDRALEAICMKALAKNPEDRYQTYSEMGQELLQYIEGRRELILKREASDLTRIKRRETTPKAIDDYELAIKFLQEEIKRKEEQGRTDTIDDKVKIIKYLYEKAKLHVPRNEPAKTIACYDMADELIAKPLCDLVNLKLVGRLNMGMRRFNQGDYVEAMQILEENLPPLQRSNDNERLIIAYFNLGLINRYLYEADITKVEYFEKSKTYYSNGVDLSDKFSNAEQERLKETARRNSVECRVGLALLLADNPKHREKFKSEIESLYQKAIEHAGDTLEYRASACTALADYLENINDLEQAKCQGEAAYKAAYDSGADNALCEAAFILGRIYHRREDRNKRIEYMKMALTNKDPRGKTLEKEVTDFYSKNGLDINELHIQKA